MSGETAREVVERIYERWNRHEGDLALDLFHPEVEIRQMARMFDSEGTFHGHEGLVRSGRELAEAWSRIEWKPDEWIDAGDSLVVALTSWAVGAMSGIEAKIEIAHLWRVQMGLVTEFRVYETKEAALEAAEGRDLPETA